jgi:hypothetical protein
VKRLLEWIAAAVGAINCVTIPVLFASRQQPIFLLPGLYFIELILLGLLVLVATAVQPSRWRGEIPWIAAGILLTFFFVAGFSIGPLLTPALIAFVVVGVLVDWQTGSNIGKHIGLFFIAAVAQAGVMGLLIMVA